MEHILAGFSAPDHPNNYLYLLWKGAKGACHNPEHARYKDYGAIGARLLPAFMADPKAFASCILDTIGHKPTRGHILKLKDVAQGFVPGNMEWVLRSKITQAQVKKGQCQHIKFNEKIFMYELTVPGHEVRKFVRLQDAINVRDELLEETTDE